MQRAVFLRLPQEKSSGSRLSNAFPCTDIGVKHVSNPDKRSFRRWWGRGNRRLTADSHWRPQSQISGVSLISLRTQPVQNNSKQNNQFAYRWTSALKSDNALAIWASGFPERYLKNHLFLHVVVRGKLFGAINSYTWLIASRPKKSMAEMTVNLLRDKSL